MPTDANSRLEYRAEPAAVTPIMDTAEPGSVGSLLLTLEEISHLVAHSHRPCETLANIVQLIQGRFHTDVCSAYLLEPERGELVLAATVGLRSESVGTVRMNISEGLTGLVAELSEPVMVSDAFHHPRFKFFPEAGEEPYHSFLGVPLIESGTLQGVLVVQTVEARTFSTNEVRMLIAVAAQLAPLVAEARLLELVGTDSPACQQAAPPPRRPSGPFQGVSCSAGVMVGQAYPITEWLADEHELPVGPVDRATEERKLTAALQAAADELSRQSKRISELVGEDHGAILGAQLMILQDRSIEAELRAGLAAGKTAVVSLTQTYHHYAAAFQKLGSARLQDRLYDLKDVFRRIRWHLQTDVARTEIAGDRLVLVAREASVMDLFAVDHARLAAVVVERGGPQCHAAILARSLGLPMVGQLPPVVDSIEPGELLLVDGTRGQLALDPPPEAMPAPPDTERVAARPVNGRTAAVRDGAGYRPRVEANINLYGEAAAALLQDVAGVGLFRSEFLVLARGTVPSEEEQVGVYRKLLSKFGGRPVSFRTFDLRADKRPHPSSGSPNDCLLDWRLVLQSPPMQQVFKQQVRAVLRAAALGRARLVVPMITRTEQVDFIRDTVDLACAELTDEGLDFRREVPVGLMIETAAAVGLMDAWAEHVDFFALGTNDLLMSALGLDRNDPVGSDRNDVLHPGLLRLVRDAVAAGHRAGRSVTVCGEMAADPRGACALAAFRVDALSVAVAHVPAVRRALERIPPPQFGADLVAARTAGQVAQLLQSWLDGRSSGERVGHSAAVP